jgi:hypothetical protein
MLTLSFIKRHQQLHIKHLSGFKFKRAFKLTKKSFLLLEIKRVSNKIKHSDGHRNWIH